MADDLDRIQFEDLMAALTRAGLVDQRDEAFESKGRFISFRRAYVTRQCRQAAATDQIDAPVAIRTWARASNPVRGASLCGAELIQTLRCWRLTEARRRKVPAFRILTNRAMEAVAAAGPRDERDLMQVKGIGPQPSIDTVSTSFRWFGSSSTSPYGTMSDKHHYGWFRAFRDRRGWRA